MSVPIMTNNRVVVLPKATYFRYLRICVFAIGFLGSRDNSNTMNVDLLPFCILDEIFLFIALSYLYIA
jgi:hypothetical protein